MRRFLWATVLLAACSSRTDKVYNNPVDSHNLPIIEAGRGTTVLIGEEVQFRPSAPAASGGVAASTTAPGSRDRRFATATRCTAPTTISARAW